MQLNSFVPWEWLYYAAIYPSQLPRSIGGIVLYHDIYTPFPSAMGVIYCATIYGSPLPSSMGWLYYATVYPPHSLVPWGDHSIPWYIHGSDYIMPWYMHLNSLVPWEWLYYATIYPPPLPSSMGWLYYATVYPPHALVPWGDHSIPWYIHGSDWRRPGDKPLSELMMVRIPTHICVTRPQWVKDYGGQVLVYLHHYFKVPGEDHWYPTSFL